MAEEGWTGLDRWVTSSQNSTISEQAVRLTNKGKCSAFGEAVVGAGRAEWDLTIEFESFGGISIGIYRQDLRDRDNVNALPTEETFTYTPNGYGYANKTGAFTFNRERKRYGQRYRHGDKITVRLDLQSRSLTFLINDETQGLAYDGLPKGAYRLATCMQFKEQKVSIQRFWTSLGKSSIPQLQSTKTVTSPKDKIGKKHETFDDDDDEDDAYNKQSVVDKNKKATQLYADYKAPVIDPDADMFGDDYNSEPEEEEEEEEDDDVYVPEESDDDNDEPDQKLNDQLDALEHIGSEEEEEEENQVQNIKRRKTSEVDTVGLIGGRSRGLSKAENKAPEPLSIESIDEDASDYFSLSGNNLKTDRSSVTCTRSNASGSAHSAFGTQLVARGRIEWMIHIDLGHSIRIGVCGTTKDATDRIFTETKYGYGYGDDGNIYFGGSHIEYNDGFKTGDIIGVYLNMDMNTLKFSVNGNDHGAAFDSIELSEKDNIYGYRLAVSLQHRPHKITLLESTLYNVERRSPRPSSNQFNINNGQKTGHQRKLSYNMKKSKGSAKTKTKTKIKNEEKEKKSNKKSDDKVNYKKKRNNKKTDRIKKEKEKEKEKNKGSGGKKKKMKKEESPSKKKGKKKKEEMAAKNKRKKATDNTVIKKKKKSKKAQKAQDIEEKKEEVNKKGNNWVKREQTTKDKWETCGTKLVIEKSSVSTKTNIKDGNSAFGKLVCKGNKMKCKWDITIKQGDNIGVGICNVIGGLKTNKNKKLLIRSFTNDINGYGYMGNDGGIQRSGRYKKYGQKFKAGDKVSILLDMRSKKLSFILNGQDQGVAFKNLPSGEYRVAASFFEKSQKITLNKTSLWDFAK